MEYHKRVAFTLAEGATHVALLDNFRKVAFTLAEVLITLGIIGVVAALTIPNLVANYQERQTVVKLKRTYSILSDAVKYTVLENGNLDEWQDDSADFFRQALTKHLKVVKTCSTYSDFVKCSGMNWESPPAYVLSDGVVIRMNRIPNVTTSNNERCAHTVSDVKNNKGSYSRRCSAIDVDLNGAKRPNKHGEDIFQFWVYTDGIIPAGSVSGSADSYIDKFDHACATTLLAHYNNRCTAWVIYHENLDYLKCRDKLSWNNGPYSCKEAENLNK